MTDKPWITYHTNLEQGSDEWLAARCGMLTASAMHLIMTATLRPAANDKERAHAFELLAQRITGYVEPSYQSDDMLRGHEDEIEARALYARTYAPVREVGFITNSSFGFTIGCSPDGLVGDDGMIEVKSRRQRFQTQTLLRRAMPEDYLLQVQTALLVTERAWCDFISFSAGMPMMTLRVDADPRIQESIVAAASAFETRLAEMASAYREVLDGDLRLLPTTRRIEQEVLI